MQSCFRYARLSSIDDVEHALQLGSHSDTKSIGSNPYVSLSLSVYSLLGVIVKIVQKEFFMYIQQKFFFALPVTPIYLLLMLFWMTSCSYVTPEAENPNPGLEKDSTDFQVQDGILSLRKHVIGYEIDQETNTVIRNTHKTWLCGWAPIIQSGKWHGAGGLSVASYRSRHCNMEFRITNNGKSLEARTINLNFPNDYGRWPLLFSIPIMQHFFYEKDVDSRGRELNKYKKVTDRANWAVRPYMDLDLQGIYFYDSRRNPHYSYSGTTQSLVTDIFDIEVSKEKDRQFIAFNGTLVHGRWGSKIQHVFRFNFLEIKENPNFVQTPYDSRNSNHMNILHILGYQPNGFDQVSYAAHWDISKPVEFCLNGFPDDYRNYRKIGEEVIEELNKAMVKIGAISSNQKAFVVSETQPKYHFDLRCPSITWVDDPILSMRAPLGIGLVNTNLKTGEILWGGAIIWGGFIDHIINRDSESIALTAFNNTYEEINPPFLSPYNSSFKDIHNHLDVRPLARGLKGFDELVQESNSYIEEMTSWFQHRRDQINLSLEKLRQQSLSAEDFEERRKELEEELERVTSLLDHFLLDKSLIQLSQPNNKVLISFSPSDQDLTYNNTWPKSEDDHILDMISWTGLSSPLPAAPWETTDTTDKLVSSAPESMSSEQVQASFQEQFSYQDAPFDSENFLENYYYDLSAAIGDMDGQERLKASQSFIKYLTLHECGHIIGLGHQFAANHMPEKGSVPPHIYNELAAEVPSRHNYSSIMDYASGRTAVSIPSEKIKIQIQDELALRYLYKQEYSTYKAGDKHFTFFQLPVNGIIPNQTSLDGKVYTARYMPQCSDGEAWLATDPHCRPWDRGYDAPTIVQENLDQYTNSFIREMNSFTEATGGNPRLAKFQLWRRTYDLMNQNRTFYDSMRYHMANNEVYNSVFHKLKKNEDALLNFSEACIDPSQALDDKWGVEFTKLAIQPLMSEMGVISLKALQEKQARLPDDHHFSYQSIYSDYKQLVQEQKDMDIGDDKYFENLEVALNEKGLTFSKLQKLCRASKQALDVAEFLLTLKGQDHTMIDYDRTIVPTGIHSGEARSDYSRMFGAYDQLGLLPIKLASLDVLTNTSSTMRWFRRWRGWNIGKPMYQDPNIGKAGYFSMYPNEFTNIVSTSIRNNMTFSGSQPDGSVNMSVANLYLNYFLFRTFFLSNDNQARGFNANYIQNLKAQTQFQIHIRPILLESIKIKNKPVNRRFGFRAKMYNHAKRALVELPQIYALPDRRIILRGDDAQIVIPITKIRFINQDTAFIWVLRVSYDRTSYDDPLEKFAVKNIMSDLAIRELDKCMSGLTGLASFFDYVDEDETDGEDDDKKETFQGFIIGERINNDIDDQTNFEKSLDDAFDTYHNREGLTPSQLACEDSVKGLGLITATVLSLNGYLIPQIYDYIRK